MTNTTFNFETSPNTKPKEKKVGWHSILYPHRLKKWGDKSPVSPRKLRSWLQQQVTIIVPLENSTTSCNHFASPKISYGCGPGCPYGHILDTCLLNLSTTEVLLMCQLLTTLFAIKAMKSATKRVNATET